MIEHKCKKNIFKKKNEEKGHTYFIPMSKVVILNCSKAAH